MERLGRILIAVFTASVLIAPGRSDAQDMTPTDTTVVETTEVKRQKAKGVKHKSLSFLRDNRVFVRAQLDQLKLQVTRTREGRAQDLNARYLLLQEMSQAIAAASDTVGAQHGVMGDTELLDSVGDLADLESQLSAMEQLLAEQRQRLLLLEQDFLGHQESAMVIVVRGLADKGIPSVVKISEGVNLIEVPLSHEQQESLRMGGIAQVYHEFVEPRPHEFEIRFDGGGWNPAIVHPIVVEAARDRLTFLELDLTNLNRASADAGIRANVWYR